MALIFISPWPLYHKHVFIIMYVHQLICIVTFNSNIFIDAY